MSTADEGWDLTVPEDADELAAELRRHGVVPGQHLHVRFDVIPGLHVQTTSPDGIEDRKLDFIGSIDGGPPDLSSRTDEYLGHGFGR